MALAPELCQALSGLGYEEPTPIQRAAIPPLLAGRDLVGQAATGTGKTAAFALPVLQRILAGGGQAEPLALVLVPTRELAMQVSEAMHSYGHDMGVRVLPIYGGQPIGRQLRALDRGVDVVVATPGRALDHIARGTLNLSGLEVVVLDEADEMLDMGFAEDIEAILGRDPGQPADRAVLGDHAAADRRHGAPLPARPGAGRDSAASASASARRRCWCGRPPTSSPRGHKPAALGRVLDLETPAAAVVFCRTRDEVDQLTETLNDRGYRAEALHGGMDQQQRDRVMGRLRGGSLDLLVATDVAARGLDIEQLTHVVNFDVPSAPESYVHRIGRVGRAGREGTAITLAEPREHKMLKTIERATGRPIAVEKVPTVADLRASRLELTRAALRQSLLEDDLDDFRAVVEPLGEEFGIYEVALAAVKLATRRAKPPREEEELPEVDLALPDDRGGRAQGRRPRPAARPPGGCRHDAAVRGDRPVLRSPAAGSCRCHRPRVVPVRPGHRRDRDRRPLLARRGSRVSGRRRGRGAPAGQHQGPEDNRPPRTLPHAVASRALHDLPAGTCLDVYRATALPIYSQRLGRRAARP